MMVQKHLHELLKQDQEPFLLQNYIADRRSRLNINNPSSSSTKQSTTLFKKACLFSFQDSPDPQKSPLFLSPTLAKNCSNAVLHIPARTAALLLEAAMKIHKQSSVSKKPKSNKKAAAVGLIDSVLRRLGSRNRDRTDSAADSRTSISPEKNFNPAPTLSVSGGNSRRNSTFWSERSLDFDRCSSSTSTEEESHEHIPVPEKLFSLHANGGLSPEFSSPVVSPAGRRTKEGNKKSKEGSLEIEKDQEEDEQFSPVSVLEPQFEDDEIQEDSDNTELVEGNFDRECSYANVQRAKQQLLEKLRRFERLAQLDPYELDKALLDDEDDQEDHDLNDEEEDHEDDYFINEVLGRSGFQLDKVVGLGIKRLVSDLIVEEEKRGEEGYCERAAVMKRVCVRLDEWKESKPESIDMMIELDFRREFNSKWEGKYENNKKNEEEVKEIAIEIQIAILVELIEEISDELLIAC